MSSKLRFFLLIAAFMVGAVAFVGCEVDPAEDDTSADVKSDEGTETDVPDALDYRFVRIDDLSELSNTPQGGADIDAIVLSKADGTVAYANNVEAFTFGPGESDTIDSREALGAPDSFFKYGEDDTTVCETHNGQHSERPFVSLGGEGGNLVVRMEAAIEVGDSLTVLEVGNCTMQDDNEQAIAEPVDVSVSVASDLDGQWEALGQGQGPEISFNIESLPEVFAD